MTSGQLVGNRIVVWDLSASRKLFGDGYFGKPLGVPKPKGTEFDAPLVLDLIEGLYLVENQLLTVYGYECREVSLAQIKKLCKGQYANFNAKYVVFKNLRQKGYIVTPGIKFGCDFAVYQHGPGIDHAPYLIQVFMHSDEISATGIVLAGRLATTVKKQFVLAVPSTRAGTVDYIGFDWWRA